MSEQPSIRVLSYNINKGFASHRLDFVLSRIKECIRLVHADIVFLQEVVGEHKGHAKRVEDWPDATQFEYLADEVWPHFAYGKNAVYKRGHHGNAILSKYPIVLTENEDITLHRLESRGVLYAKVQYEGSGPFINCYCSHLNLRERDRLVQSERLCDFIRQTSGDAEPCVLAGDFNDWKKSLSDIITEFTSMNEAFETLRGAAARTFPSWFPALCLDRIYSRGFEVSTAEVLSGEPWNGLSDHAALFAELILINEKSI